MPSTKLRLMYRLVIAVIACSAGAANAVTQIILPPCTPPTTRLDGSALSSAELGPYTFFLDGIQIGTSTTCTFTYPIPRYATIKTTQVFTVIATDKNGLTSPRSNGFSLLSNVTNKCPHWAKNHNGASVCYWNWK